MSKLGIHVASNNRTGLGEMLDAGPACVVAVDQNVIAEVRDRAPGAVIAFRTQKSPLGKDNPPNLIDAPETQWRSIADAWMNSLLPFWAQTPGADVYIVNNELDVSTLQSARALNAFYLGCMEMAEAAHLRIGICSFSTGCPSDDGDLTLEQRWEPLLPAIARAEQGGHVVVLHVHPLNYGPLLTTGESIAFRHERSLRYFAAHGLHPHMLLGELSNGVGGVEPNLNAYLQQVCGWDVAVMASPWRGQVIGCALYGFNARETLATAAYPLAQWIREHPTPNDPPTPIEQRTYERVVHLLPLSVRVALDDAHYRLVVELAGPGRESIICSADDAFIVPPQCKSRTVYVYNVDEWGGRAALEAWVQEYYAPLPTIVYRELPHER